MNRILSTSFAVGALLAAAAHAQAAEPASGETTTRRVEQVVVSDADPATRVRVHPDFHYIGRTNSSVMNDTATAEQFWFGDVRDGVLTRAVVVHFERWKDGTEGAFNYPRLRMVRLGAHEYLHQSFSSPTCEIISPEVRALAESEGAAVSKGCVMTRFVRGIGDDKRSELIFFYIEAAEVGEDPPEGWKPGGLPIEHGTPDQPQSPWGEIDARLTASARLAFEVLD